MRPYLTVPFALLVAACSASGPSTPDGGADAGPLAEGGAATKLAIDCRLDANGSDPRCQRFALGSAHSVGKGPIDRLYRFGGGFVDAAKNRLVISFSCTVCSQHDTGVMAVDLVTGDRTLLSGTVNDAVTGIQSVGAGDPFTHVGDVQLAPNGKWWDLDTENFGAGIDEIDAATGDRTPLYTQAQLDAQTGLCKVNGLGVGVGWDTPVASGGGDEGLANLVVHPDGKIYLRGERSYDAAQKEIDLEIVAELSQGTCRIVTAFSSKDSAFNHGTGPAVNLNYGWLTELGGALVSSYSVYYLHAIDVATGNRTMLSSADPNAMVGSGGKFGGSFNGVAPDGKTILTTSASQSPHSIVAIDGATGDRVAWDPTAGPQQDNLGAIVFAHPTLAGVYIMAGGGMITLFEPATGNSVYLSR